MKVKQSLAVPTIHYLRALALLGIQYYQISITGQLQVKDTRGNFRKDWLGVFQKQNLWSPVITQLNLFIRLINCLCLRYIKKFSRNILYFAYEIEGLSALVLEAQCIHCTILMKVFCKAAHFCYGTQINTEVLYFYTLYLYFILFSSHACKIFAVTNAQRKTQMNIPKCIHAVMWITLNCTSPCRTYRAISLNVLKSRILDLIWVSLWIMSDSEICRWELLIAAFEVPL